MGWLEGFTAPGGAVAGTFAALCCAGAPGALAFVSALGAWMVWLAAGVLVAASIWNLLPAPKPSYEPAG